MKYSFFKTLKNTYNYIYKKIYNLDSHEIEIRGVYLEIKITLKTIDAKLYTDYLIKVLKYEIAANTVFLHNNYNDSDDKNITIIVVMTFKSKLGWRGENVKMISVDFESIQKIDYISISDQFNNKFNEFIEKYNIEFIDYISVKIF